MYEIEKTADELDRANELANAENEYRVAEVRARNAPEQVMNPDGTWPITECECGEEIPVERIQMGKIRCVYCQTKLENRKAKR